jgi:hypothetical protein
VAIVGWLRYQDSATLPFDEVMRSDVCHDLCTGQDFGVEFCLQLPELLDLVRNCNVTF